jgi:hypothetical protein
MKTLALIALMATMAGGPVFAKDKKAKNYLSENERTALATSSPRAHLSRDTVVKNKSTIVAFVPMSK